jgi:hypothetical protein
VNQKVVEKCIAAVDFYLETKSIEKTARKYKLRNNYLSQYLKSIGIEVSNHQNTPKMDFNIFDSIDSEEKAYWLGFLYADGYVSLEKYGIELSLQLSDTEHLEKFKKFLKWSNAVKKDSFRCRVSFRNKHLHSRLIELGCLQQKSLILKFPNNKQVPDYLINHFIRGYIDGDGCIYIYKAVSKTYSSPALNILGTEEFLNTLKKCKNWRDIKIYKKSKQQARTLNYCGKYVVEMLDEIYANSTIYLDRKYEKYLLIKKLYNAPMCSNTHMQIA